MLQQQHIVLYESKMHFLLQKDIGSDECDKDSGYEPDQVNFWPRNPVSSAKRAGFRNKKQRSLDVHDVRKGLQSHGLFLHRKQQMFRELVLGLIGSLGT